MTYFLIEDGQIVDTNIPSTGVLPDGSAVSGFDKLEPEVLKEMGWVPVVTPEPPAHDPETQHVTQDFEIQEDQVVVVYEVKDNPEPEPETTPEPTFAERLAAIEEDVRGMKERAAAATVSNVDAGKIRDAITGNPNA